MNQISDPVLILAAVIPAVFLVIRIYRADRLEREPGRLIRQLLLMGALSTLGAGLGELIGDTVLQLFWPENSPIYDVLFYFGVVAFAEEGCKYILLKAGTWKSPEFNCQFDGVVYAVVVALGFALWENVGYVLEYGLSTALVRAVTAVPGHACFGVFMGAYYGMARRFANAGMAPQARWNRQKAVLMPALLHGAYDFICTVDDDAWIFLGFVILLFVTSFRMVRKLSRQDRYIVAPRHYFDW